MWILNKLLYYLNIDDIYCLMLKKKLIVKNRKFFEIDLKEIMLFEVME